MLLFHPPRGFRFYIFKSLLLSSIPSPLSLCHVLYVLPRRRRNAPVKRTDLVTSPVIVLPPQEPHCEENFLSNVSSILASKEQGTIHPLPAQLPSRGLSNGFQDWLNLITRNSRWLSSLSVLIKRRNLCPKSATAIAFLQFSLGGGGSGFPATAGRAVISPESPPAGQSFCYCLAKLTNIPLWRKFIFKTVKFHSLPSSSSTLNWTNFYWITSTISVLLMLELQ